MNEVKDLIADARKARVQESVFPIHTRMLDALEAQQARIAELEAELGDIQIELGVELDRNRRYRTRNDEQATVIEKVRVAATEEFTWQQFGSAVDRILATAPADLLREHDADVWDAAQTPVVSEPGTNPRTTLPPNPYRVKPENEWVDPEPWFYPVSGMRTAHKLAYTNAEYRPRKVKPEDEQ